MSVKKYYTTIIGAVIGAIGGFAYYKFVGCKSGQCPITSSPYISTFYGSIIGGLVFDIFRKSDKNKKNE